MTRFAQLVSLVALALAASSSLASAGGIKLPPILQPNPPVFHFPTLEKDPPVIHIPVDFFPKDPKNTPNNSGDSGVTDTTPRPHLTCLVGGTPESLPNDIWLTNAGGGVIDAGVKIRYTIPSLGVKGAFLLPRSIDAGTQVKVADLFGGALPGTPCTAKIIP